MIIENIIKSAKDSLPSAAQFLKSISAAINAPNKYRMIMNSIGRIKVYLFIFIVFSI